MKDAKLAKRRLRESQEKAGKLAGTTEDRKITFEQLAERWLVSRKVEIKDSSYTRRITTVKGLGSYFKGQVVTRPPEKTNTAAVVLRITFDANAAA